MSSRCRDSSAPIDDSRWVWPVRTLLFSTLYPSAARPHHGLFVEKRARELERSTAVRARVVAPVPWFPWRSPAFGEYAAFAATPDRESRAGIEVEHPRYLNLPKIGMTLAPLTLALGAWPRVRQLAREGGFDVIDAHYAYPDGVAAALLGQWIGKPVVITARGSDLNLIARFALPRRMLRWAARRAFACVGVSAHLAGQWKALGAREVHVLRNGVDCTTFRPIEPALARERLGLGKGPVIVSVGNLVPLKRHAWIIDAVAALQERHPGLTLAIVGRGPLDGDLAERARRAGVGEQVRLAGAVAQDELHAWYSAADVSVLASEREGWPNVLLESMACGTPVVAASVGGVPEIVESGTLGLMFEPTDPAALADALSRALHRPWDRAAVRAHALAMNWDETSRLQEELFQRAAQGHRQEP